MPQIIKTGIDKLFEVTRQKDQESLITVLVALQTNGAMSAEQLLAGIRKSTDQLEDLRFVRLTQLVTDKQALLFLRCWIDFMPSVHAQLSPNCAHCCKPGSMVELRRLICNRTDLPVVLGI